MFIMKIIINYDSIKIYDYKNYKKIIILIEDFGYHLYIGISTVRACFY